MWLALNALLPVFLLIGGGYLMHRTGFPGDGFWPAAERLTYYVLFPALLFSSLANASLDNAPIRRSTARYSNAPASTTRSHPCP